MYQLRVGGFDMKDKKDIWGNRLKRHWKMALVIVVGLICQYSIAVQIFYPSNRLLPLAKIDYVFFGGWEKNDVTARLDNLYQKTKLSLYFGKAKSPYASPKLSDIGLTVSNSDRFNNANYPWYLRLAPLSIFWAQYIIYNQAEPNYVRNADVQNEYISNVFGDSCIVKPKDATLEYDNKKLKLVPSQSGGNCNSATVRQILSHIKPRLNNYVVIGSTETKPDVNDDTAKQFAATVTKKVSAGINLTVNNEIISIPTWQLLGWMDFSTVDGKLTYSLSAIKASAYLESEVSPKVAISPGVTIVTTYDFIEAARITGASGQGLNVVATLENVQSSIEDPGVKATAVTIAIEPTVEYNRQYSSTDTGIMALIEQYAEAHKGVNSVSFVELSGAHRRASYNSDNVLVSASTYKLYTAYSALKRVEEGVWSWTDQIEGGRDLATCFDDMIVQSDNACAEAISEKAGWRNVTDEAHALGCNNTNLSNTDGYARTSSGDLALFLAQLQMGQILTKQSSRDLLINALKRNAYRSGIPSGVGYEVADKVGFIDDTLNDAAIVYSPTGAYVLVIMTNGSSWTTIADLTGQIEALRAR